jgi:hypothetical protein
VASLAANVAVAEPTAIGRVIAAWPSFALIGSYELLMRHRWAASPDRERAAMPTSPSAMRLPSRRSRQHRRGGRAGVILDWMCEGRRGNGRWPIGPGGSLPSGKVIGDRYRRHERWGRLVKASGTAGEFG